MSLFDNVKQTITDVAGSVIDQGKSLSQVTQLQMNLKKLQLERAKRVHELGKRTFEWYRGGNLVVSGPVPGDVGELCLEIDDLDRQSNDAERRIQAIQEEHAANVAQQAAHGAPPAASSTPPTQPLGNPPAPPVYTPPPGYTPPPAYSPPPAPPASGMTPPHAAPPPPPNPNYGPPPHNSTYNTSVLPDPDAGNAPGTTWNSPSTAPQNPPRPPGTDADHPFGPPSGS